MATRTPKASLTRETGTTWRILFDEMEGVASHLLGAAEAFGSEDAGYHGKQMDKLARKAQKLRNQKPKAPVPTDKERLADIVVSFLTAMEDEFSSISGADFVDEVSQAAHNLGLLPQTKTGDEHGV